MNKKALIIGNGVSRKPIDLNVLAPNFTTFGCNALYRNFKPDYLVAIDDIIIGEIIQSDYPKDRFIVPPIEEQYEPVEWNPNRPRENAGMVAMREAIKLGCNELNCIGMDFLIDNEGFNMGNLYDSTAGYGPETRASMHDTISRALYFNWFVDKHPETMFVAVFPKVIIESEVFRVAPKPNFDYAFC
jgi:hypothetical protein